MAEQRIEIFVAKTPEGRAVVASALSPYFLFEADTEKEALEISRRALTFYFGSRPTAERRHPRVPPRVSKLLDVRRDEILVAA